MTIYDGARPDERFFVQTQPPTIVSHFDVKILRRTHWKVSNGSFVSWWFGNHLHFYHGDSKCDGSRTYWARMHKLIAETDYVMTTTPKELLAFRFRRIGPTAPVWDAMGGT